MPMGGGKCFLCFPVFFEFYTVANVEHSFQTKIPTGKKLAQGHTVEFVLEMASFTDMSIKTRLLK